jgi:hypothetical protein
VPGEIFIRRQFARCVCPLRDQSAISARQRDAASDLPFVARLLPSLVLPIHHLPVDGWIVAGNQAVKKMRFTGRIRFLSRGKYALLARRRRTGSRNQSAPEESRG